MRPLCCHCGKWVVEQLPRPQPSQSDVGAAASPHPLVGLLSRAGLGCPPLTLEPQLSFPTMRTRPAPPPLAWVTLSGLSPFPRPWGVQVFHLPSATPRGSGTIDLGNSGESMERERATGCDIRGGGARAGAQVGIRPVGQFLLPTGRPQWTPGRV